MANLTADAVIDRMYEGEHCTLVGFESNVRTTLLMTPILLYALWKAWPPKLDERLKKRVNYSVMDHLMGGILIVCLLHNLAVRFSRGVAHWNLQPCHILTALFVVVIYHPDNDPHRFLLYFYSVWMPMLGLFFSDASWYIHWYEQPAFHLQHLVMVVGPWFYVMANRFRLDKLDVDRFRAWMFALSCCILYLIVLVWVSHFYDEDFCAMKCRPHMFTFAGTWWREFSPFVIMILSFLTGPLPDLFFSGLRRAVIA